MRALFHLRRLIHPNMNLAAAMISTAARIWSSSFGDNQRIANCVPISAPVSAASAKYGSSTGSDRTAATLPASPASELTRMNGAVIPEDPALHHVR